MSIELSNSEDFISWVKTKVEINKNAMQARARFVKRGDVYWCHFGLNIGSEISKTTPRPAVIIQNFVANRNSSNTIVVPVTHDTSILPCLVPITSIKKPDGSALLDGQVNTSNIVCISKARLGDFICTLPKKEMKKIDESIAKSVDLMHYYKKAKDKNKSIDSYCVKIKNERNKAQNTLKKIQEYLNNTSIENMDESTINMYEKIVEILDIQ